MFGLVFDFFVSFSMFGCLLWVFAWVAQLRFVGHPAIWLCCSFLAVCRVSGSA